MICVSPDSGRDPHKMVYRLLAVSYGECNWASNATLVQALDGRTPTTTPSTPWISKEQVTMLATHDGQKMFCLKPCIRRNLCHT